MSNVFQSPVGRRSPIQTVLLAFLVSGLLYEMGFAIATSRFDGYQFELLMLQVPAVIAGRDIQWLKAASTLHTLALYGSTMLWMWATSMLFFHRVNPVCPSFFSCTRWLP